MRLRRKTGFTLIEILVVVSIIAVLIAILLPAISGARENARGVQCSSGMRQWGIANGCYGADFKGFIPARGDFTGSISYRSGTDPRTAYTGARLASAWYNALPRYINVKPYGEAFSGTGAVTSNDEFGAQVVPDAAALTGTNSGGGNNWLWWCPSMIFKDKTNGAGTSGGHYSMNGALLGSGSYDYDSTPFKGKAPDGSTSMTEAKRSNHLKLDRISISNSQIPFILEGHIQAFVTPLGGTGFARWRHNRGSAVPSSAADTYNFPGGSGLTGEGWPGTTNILFLDGRSATFVGNDVAGGSTTGRGASTPLQADPFVSIPARGVLGRRGNVVAAPYEQLAPQIITWGPFYP